MNKLWLGAVLAATAMTVQAFADTVTSVNVVGYVNLTVYGGSNDTYTLIAAPMTKVPVARGTITANTTTTITDADALWIPNTFAAGTTNLAVQPGASTYYVEVTSGALEGRHFYISGNSATTLTLNYVPVDPPEFTADELVGATYKIIPANRIRDIFGEPGSLPALLGGSGPTTADNIRLMGAGGWGAAIYYRNSGRETPQNSWILGTSAANDVVIDRDLGMLVLRRAGQEGVDLTVVGEVSANTQTVVVQPGFALLGGMSAVSVSIGASGLVDVLLGGSSTGNADLLYAWDNAKNAWGLPVYYRNAGRETPQNTWIQGTSDVANTFMIEPGRAYLVKRGGTENKVWGRQSPL